MLGAAAFKFAKEPFEEANYSPQPEGLGVDELPIYFSILVMGVITIYQIAWWDKTQVLYLAGCKENGG
jgi:hypothetical protein